MKEIIIEVEGMRCGMCESHVCDAIRRASDKVKKLPLRTLKTLPTLSPRTTPYPMRSPPRSPRRATEWAP
ncbi:MAG: hypothetical protein ACLUSP_07685 [Christensenellales bacterium]